MVKTTASEKPDQDEKEAAKREEAIRAKYKAEIAEKVNQQVKLIIERDEEKKRSKEIVDNEKRAKAKRAVELKEMIGKELEKIKAMDEEKIRKKQKEEQSKNMEAAIAKVRREEEEKMKGEIERRRKEDEWKKNEQIRLKVQDEIKARKEQHDLQYRLEIKRAQKDAVERSNRLQTEEQRKRMEKEENMKIAIEKEMKKLEQEEKVHKEQKIEDGRKKRSEEARFIEAEISGRKQEEQEREKMAKIEVELQKQRDIQALKKKVHEEKQNRFKEDVTKQDMQVPVLQKAKRKSVNNNPLLNRFEEMANYTQLEEEIRKSEIEEKKKKRKPFVLKAAAKDCLKKSTNKLAKVMSKDILLKRKGSKNLLKVLSRENLNKMSNASLNKSRQKLISQSKDVVFLSGSKTTSKASLYGSRGSKDGLNKLKKCKSIQAINTDTSYGRQNMSNKDMKSYLISQVLFDGEETVQASAKAARPLQGVQEEEDAPTVDPDIELREKLFDDYKTEMEKYLSLFEGSIKTKKRKSRESKAPPKKAILPTIGKIKSMFESHDTNECGDEMSKPEVKVGRLDPLQIQTHDDNMTVKKKKARAAPVVIDRDAFDRTMNQFEHYRQEEEERERRRLAEEKRRIDILDRRRRREEDSRRREEQEILEADMKLEQELYDSDEYSDVSSTESTKELNHPEGKVITEEEKISQMSIKERIKYELTRLSGEENLFREKITRENKKKQLMKQIQEQVLKIKGLDVTSPNPNVDDTPMWIKLIKDAELKHASASYVLAEHSLSIETAQRDNRMEDFTIINNSLGSSEPPMSYEDTVTALLSLIDEERMPTDKPKFMKKKKENVNVKIVYEAKQKFEQLSNSSPISPGPQISPYEINTVSIEKARLRILKSQKSTDKQNDSMPKQDKNMFSKKCSDIKDMLTKKIQKEETDMSQARKKKKLIQVAVEPSIDDLLNARKEKNKTQEWAYQNKTVNDFLCHSLHTQDKHTMKVASKASTVMKEVEKLHMEKQIKDDNDVDEFMINVHKYLQKPTASEKEDIFKSSIIGYLQLIEDKSEAGERKTELPHKTIGKLSKDSLELQGTDCSLRAREIGVGKLDTSLFQIAAPGKNNERKDIKSMTKSGCDSIKTMLESKQSNVAQNVTLKNYKKKRLVDFGLDQTVDVNSSSLGRKTDWKWKAKKPEIQALQQYVKREALGAQIVKKAYSQNTEELERKTRDLDKIMQDKELEFDNLMCELQSFQAPATYNIQDSTHSYLQLIDDGVQLSEKLSLPKLTAQPWKIEDIKHKMASKSKATDITGKIVIGKLSAFSFKNGPDGQQGKNQSNATLVNTDKVKKMFEANSKLGSMKTVSELNLAPRRKVSQRAPNPYCKMDMPLPRRHSVVKKWTNTIANYLTEKPRPHIDCEAVTQNAIPIKKAEKPDDNMGWKSIADPKERNNAILIKHGFKPRDAKKEEAKEVDLDEELGTIPKHILDDEILYRKYMERELGLIGVSSSESSSCSSISSPKYNGNSTSGLLDILGKMKKAALTKASVESKRKYSEAIQNGSHRKSRSERDLSQIPGSCSFLKKQFDYGVSQYDAASPERIDISGVMLTRTRSISRKKREMQDSFTKSLTERESYREMRGMKSGCVGSVKDLLESGKLTQTEIIKYFSPHEQDSAKKQSFHECQKALLQGSKVIQSGYDQEGINTSISCSSLKHMWEEQLGTRNLPKSSPPFVSCASVDGPACVSHRRKSLQDQFTSPATSECNRHGDDSTFVNPGHVGSIRGLLESGRLSQAEVNKYARATEGNEGQARAQFQRALGQMSQGPTEMISQQERIQRSSSCSSMKQMWERQLSNPQSEVKNSFTDLCGGAMVGSVRARLLEAGAQDNSGRHNMMGSELDMIRAARINRDDADSGGDHANGLDSRQRVQIELEALRMSRNRYTDDGDDESAENTGMSERDRIQFELAALREVRKKSSLSRISHGDRERRTSSQLLKRSSSASRVTGDLDQETMQEVRANNAKVKAMFESAGPKYKFGGGGESRSEENVSRGPVKRPSSARQPTDERKWVLDTINQGWMT